MRAIVDGAENFSYMKFQPGDGTIYTVLYGQVDKENYYIALGAGDHIAGGYFFRVESAREMLVQLVKWIERGGTPLDFIREYHWIQYISSHINASNFWTETVMCLFAAIVTQADPSNGDAYGLISAVYHDDDDAVLEWVEEWGVVV